jgi:hypothetical protein
LLYIPKGVNKLEIAENSCDSRRKKTLTPKIAVTTLQGKAAHRHAAHIPMPVQVFKDNVKDDADAEDAKSAEPKEEIEFNDKGGAEQDAFDKRKSLHNLLVKQKEERTLRDCENAPEVKAAKKLYKPKRARIVVSKEKALKKKD